jgi:hypothetical protein
MSFRHAAAGALFALSLVFGLPSESAEVCQKYGPQTPRDIGNKTGVNPRLFALAPPPGTMNLCNIHFHANAEHKGPGFAVSAGSGEHGGYKCNGSDRLTKADLQTPAQGACKGIKPGDTVEVHWVFTSCDVAPGEGLGSCLSDQCANPTLRVEAQIFLVVNDGKAEDFSRYDYAGNIVDGRHQPKALPVGTGEPVVFLGSTTGPNYSQAKCSPLQVTWSVRPACTRVSIDSLNRWCAGNAFKEDHAHGVRPLVTAPELLSRID